MSEIVKTCIACGRPLADRVEDAADGGVVAGRPTDECSTYRVWYCANSECVMYKTDLYRESLAPRSDR